MLNRRQLLQTAIAGGMLGPRLASATRPLGGVLPQQKDFRFYNATLLDAKGIVQKNWGGEVKDGILRLSKDIKDGSDLDGKWIVPNFIDAGCTVGLYEVDLESSTHDDSESSGSEQPLLIAGDGYNPLSATIPTIRANGIGSVILHPSFDRLVVGSMSHVYLAGVTKAETVVPERLSVCIGLGRTGKGHDGPSTRMGIAARFEKYFGDVSNSTRQKSKWRKSSDVPELTGADAIWRKVADGELPVVFSAHRADDIELAMSLITEFELSGMILGAAEAWIHAEALAKQEIPLLLGNLTVQPSSFEHLHARYDNAKILHDAGVQFAFRSASNHDSRRLPSEVAVAVAHGLPFEAAIQALCFNATQFFPMHEPYVIGENEMTVANFFICDGDPLQPRNGIHQMWIDGRNVTCEQGKQSCMSNTKICRGRRCPCYRWIIHDTMV